MQTINLFKKPGQIIIHEEGSYIAVLVVDENAIDGGVGIIISKEEARTIAQKIKELSK